jgi:ketosteroid isomerase-like protein
VPVTSKLGDHSEAKGARGFKAWLEESEDIMPWEMEPEGAVDIGPGRVLAVTTMRWHGAASEIDIEQRLWILLTVADGKITRSEGYLDPADALRAAGASTE